MAIHGIRLIPLGLVVLSTAVAGAQSTMGKVQDAGPASAVPKAASSAPPAPLGAAAVADAAAPVRVPEPPKRPAEMPPKPPKVTCSGDQLTISADNSTLDSILAAVKGCTGAHIDIPSGAGTFRSFEQFGPGPARQVLDELLSGTKYNYVIQSSAANPLKVEMVLLTMPGSEKDNPNAPSADIPITPGRRAWQHMQKFDKPDPNNPNKPMDESTDTPEAESTAAATTDTAPADTNTAVAPANPPAQPASADASTPTDPSGPPAAQAAEAAAPATPPAADPSANGDPSKAVEDRISAMQQMFNQRQQMIQKQNQPPSTAPNTPNN